MKRVLTSILALVLITGATEMHQLLKIPFLLQHFRDHRNEDSSLSFYDFLKIHYTKTHHPDDNDDQEDSELPFKSTGNIFHLDIPVVAKKEASQFIIDPLEKVRISHPEGTPCRRTFSIFHPPRIA